MRKLQILIIATLLTSTSVFGQTYGDSLDIVQANNKNLVYQGRVDFTNPNKPSFGFPGVSVSMNFKAKNIYLLVEGDKNYYEVIMDGKVVNTVGGTNPDGIYKLNQESLNKGEEHTITVFKRTESNQGICVFQGFGLKKGEILPSTIKLPKRKIEVIGNSITCGYGNMVSEKLPPEGNPSTGFFPQNENNYLAWGAITSRNLNTQYMCTAYSGKGMYRDFGGNESGTIPLLYDRIFADDPNSPKWDFSKYVPDVVVINLGTNDFAQEVNNNTTDSVKYVTAYLAFIDRIKANYKDAKIICAIGSMMSDSYPTGKFTLTRIRRFVNSVVTEANKKYKGQIFFFEFQPQTPPFGEDWHPDLTTHQLMADNISVFIKEITGWK